MCVLLQTFKYVWIIGGFAVWLYAIVLIVFCLAKNKVLLFWREYNGLPCHYSEVHSLCVCVCAFRQCASLFYNLYDNTVPHVAERFKNIKRATVNPCRLVLLLLFLMLYHRSTCKRIMEGRSNMQLTLQLTGGAVVRA